MSIKIEYSDLGKEWIKDDMEHRVDGPSFIELDGIKGWNLKGDYNRGMIGPDIIRPDGYKDRGYSNDDDYWDQMPL